MERQHEFVTEQDVQRCEQQFVEAVQDDNYSQFVTVMGDFIRICPSIIGHLWRKYFFNLHDREDIVADALCRVWEKRSTFDASKGSFRTWFTQISRNVAVDKLRSQKKTEHLESSLHDDPADTMVDHDSAGLDDTASGDDVRDPPGTSPEKQSELEHLQAILNQLSDTDQKIILRYAETDGEGHWAKELEESLKMTSANIRVRRKRIMEKIATEMLKRLKPTERSREEVE